MRNFKVLVVCGVLLLWNEAPLFAQEGKVTVVTPVAIAPPEHPATVAQIREMYELTGLHEVLQSVVQQMMTSMRTASGDRYPASVWDQMNRDFRSYDFFSAIAPAYERYVSEEDLAMTLAYLRSDAARRIKQTDPFIKSAVAEVAGKAGREIGEKAARDHMDEIIALQKKNDAAAAARANGTTSKPQIVLPPEVKSQ